MLEETLIFQYSQVFLTFLAVCSFIVAFANVRLSSTVSYKKCVCA